MTSLRCVSSTEIVSAILKPSFLTSSRKVSDTHIAFIPKAGSIVSSPGTSGLAIAVEQHENLAHPEFMLRHDGAVDLDPVGLWARSYRSSVSLISGMTKPY